ncbi:MAG: MBL fold metallo-hydrolase [Flammeovirgaceae bacterium]
MKLTFWGAARQVPGSMFLLELEEGYTILIDCGLDNGKPEENPVYQGSCFPFDASEIDLVLLTHAHLDHSGKIPNLFRDGFEGQILCTSPTLQLAEILLNDSATLNQRKLQAFNKKSYSKKAKETLNLHELYLEKHVHEAMERFVPLSFNKKFNVKRGLDITFIPTGHLLGAANILLEIKENGQEKRILFSGDIGRHNYPLLPDPEEVPQVDYLICESTYGNRKHLSTNDSREEIRTAIQKTCVEIPGRLIIPAFSIGRTQAVLFTLHQLYVEGKLPKIKIFADSPLAYRSNIIHERFASLMNEEAKLFKETEGSLFGFESLYYIANSRESREISNYSEPCIIISASGMMEGGRVQHHIEKNLQNPYCCILMVGYSAEGTMGHKLLHGNGFFEVGKHEVKVNARIQYTDTFSGHGDMDDLLKFVGYQKPSLLKKLFIVHGEESVMNDFKQTLIERGYQNIEIPIRGQSFEL